MAFNEMTKLTNSVYTNCTCIFNNDNNTKVKLGLVNLTRKLLKHNE